MIRQVCCWQPGMPAASTGHLAMTLPTVSKKQECRQGEVQGAGRRQNAGVWQDSGPDPPEASLSLALPSLTLTAVYDSTHCGHLRE